MSKGTFTPEETVNGISFGLSASGHDHVLKQLKTWPTNELAVTLIEAIFQRNRLLNEKKDKEKEAKNIMGGGLAKQQIGGKDK